MYENVCYILVDRIHYISIGRERKKADFVTVVKYEVYCPCLWLEELQMTDINASSICARITCWVILHFKCRLCFILDVVLFEKEAIKLLIWDCFSKSMKCLFFPSYVYYSVVKNLSHSLCNKELDMTSSTGVETSLRN